MVGMTFHPSMPRILLPLVCAANVRIDCGGQYDYKEAVSGLQWTADLGYSSGEPSIVLFPGNSFLYSNSLRYFPRGRRNCYSIPVETGRYFVRLFFDYGNYNLKNQVSKGHQG